MRTERIALIVMVVFLSVANRLNAQADFLQSGPMVGYAEMREVALWVQTTRAVEVFFEYYDTAATEQRFRTATLLTDSYNAFTATLIADKVQPGRVYEYTLFINNARVEPAYPTRFRTPALWQWRSDPPALRFALGSCAFINDSLYDRPGKPYGGNYEIFGSIAARRPDVMLWLGDNVYLREPDWNSRTGVLYRYTHSRSLPELQPLLASCSHYAIWDDHDYGPNDSDKSFWNKEITLEAFKLFWANPGYGAAGMEGISTSFEWTDCQFFLLDNRWNRSPNKRSTGERHILGDEQLEWLVSALAASSATFKFVAIGGQVLNPVARYENYANYAEERAKLLRLIEQEQIRGVIFLSGDRHHTDMSKLERSGTYPLYEFTVSPLTSGTYGKSNEPNYLRMPETSVGERNFAIMEIRGAADARELVCTVYNAQGEALWSRTLNAADLR